jgi:glycosyltransferase involved in cell wall biosynthesis
MRLLWATPFNQRSAIATFSRAVGEELVRKGHVVDIVRTEVGESATIPATTSSLAIVDAPDPSTCEHRYDLMVVNLGNHQPYHGRCLDFASRYVPFCIFHDADLRDFAWGVQNGTGLDIGTLVRGAAGEADLDPIMPAPARDHLAFLGSMACGAVVHGPHYRDTIRSATPGPVGVIPLCFPDLGAIAPRPHGSTSFKVVVFGMINPNKQVVRIIRALALIKDRFACELKLVGPYEDRTRAEYENLSRELGVPSPEFTGFVSDEDLFGHLAAADVICCLRYPISEGGSASLATALYAAKPVIVCDAASYAMVPDHHVTKVSYGEDPSDLAEALGAHMEDPHAAHERGLKTRKWAKTAFSARSYVAKLEPLLHEALKGSPWLRTMHRMQQFAPIGQTEGNASISRVFSELTARRVV